MQLQKPRYKKCDIIKGDGNDFYFMILSSSISQCRIDSPFESIPRNGHVFHGLLDVMFA